MISLISGSEVFIISSRKEPFGLVALEAMAAGSPVVASNVGGIPEILQDGCGILVPPDDEKALADAIEKLLTNEDFRRSLVMRGSERVKEFSWDRAAQAYLALGVSPSSSSNS